jgi:hypothetical protein
MSPFQRCARSLLCFSALEIYGDHILVEGSSCVVDAKVGSGKLGVNDHGQTVKMRRTDLVESISSVANLNVQQTGTLCRQ